MGLEKELVVARAARTLVAAPFARQAESKICAVEYKEMALSPAELERHDSATLIQSHVRGKRARKGFDKSRSAARDIQRVHRSNKDKRDRANRVLPEEATAIELVERFLKMEGDFDQRIQAAAAEFMTMDFVDELKMHGQKTTTKGIAGYLAKAGTKQHPRITEIFMKPLVVGIQSSEHAHVVTVMCEVLLGEALNMRMTFEVLIRIADGQAHVSRRFAEDLGWEATMSTAKADAHSGLHSSMHSSFAALDVDSSGHLSIDGIVNASKLVGLRFKKEQLARELLLEEAMHHSSEGAFELSEFRAVVKQQRVLAEAGIEPFDRPFVFDVLPLVARTFEAHSTVEQCLREARERDAIHERYMAEERRKALETRGSILSMLRLQRASKTLLNLPPIKPSGGGQAAPVDAAASPPQTQVHRQPGADPSFMLLSHSKRARVPEPSAGSPARSHARSPARSHARSPARSHAESSMRTTVSLPNLSRPRLPSDAPTLSTAISSACGLRDTPKTSMKGLPPLPSKTGLIAPLPKQTVAERLDVIEKARHSAAPLSRRLGVR